MSRKKRTHLRGERGQAFADKIRGIPLDQILCVSLDVHKYFHVVIIHNALEEIVAPTFEIGIFQTGFERLCLAIDEAVVQTKAQVVLTGMEPSSHYFENLARHLHKRPQPVTYHLNILGECRSDWQSDLLLPLLFEKIPGNLGQ